jgi:mono/diheme cytochrome c family protein
LPPDAQRAAIWQELQSQSQGGTMRGKRLVVTLCSLLAVSLWNTAGWAGPESDPLKPRVPDAERSDVRKIKSPITVTPDVIAKGKDLYEGRGTCANCHGMTGEGDGAGGMLLTPGPRNFTNCKFHKKRNEGELFWVIKNGSPGTGMPALVKGNVLTEEEAWTIIAYERTFCKDE